MGLGGNQYKRKQAALAAQPVQDDPLMAFLEGTSEYAPAAGSVVGGLYGGTIGALAGLPGGPATMIPMGAAGAGLGTSLGGTAGSMVKTWGDNREFERKQDQAEAAEESMQAEEDRKAEMDALKLTRMQRDQEGINKENAMIELISRFL